MTLQAFIAQYRIRMTAEWADANPNLAGDKDWAASHYKVTFRRGRRQFTTYFSMGAAHTKEPTAAEVLDCLASDVSGFQNAGSFESWCDEYGYDHDSRRAERTYRTIERQAEALDRFLGQDALDVLLWKIDRH